MMGNTVSGGEDWPFVILDNHEMWGPSDNQKIKKYDSKNQPLAQNSSHKDKFSTWIG